MNQTNEFANLSKRCVGVVALTVIPGYPLPLMATSAVLSTPSVSQPEIGLNQLQVQWTRFLTKLRQERSTRTKFALVGKTLAQLLGPQDRSSWLRACSMGWGVIRHREWIEALTKRLELDLSVGGLGAGAQPVAPATDAGCPKS